MALITRTLAGGGANPDVTVQVDNDGAKDLPVYKPRRQGFDEYDSGPFDVFNGAPASVTTDTIYPEGGTLSNTGDEQRIVTWTNTAGGVLGVEAIPPKKTIPWPLPTPGSFVGLKVGADGPGVRGQIAGGK